MDEYSSTETGLAYARYNAITGGDRADFIHWLGLIVGFTEELRECHGLRIGKNHRRYACVKMDALLSPYWYALMKAYVAREEASQIIGVYRKGRN